MIKWISCLFLVMAAGSASRAGASQSCEISLAPKSVNLLEQTFKHKPQLADQFIRVLMEDHNLFLGPILMSYFDQVMVQKGYLKAQPGLNYTAYSSSRYARANRKALMKFESVDKIEQVKIAKEIWQRIVTDLEINEDDVVNGKSVLVRFQEKKLAVVFGAGENGLLREANWNGLGKRVDELVELRSALIELRSQPGGEDLILAFIVNSLPFHSRYLSELQIDLQKIRDQFPLKSIGMLTPLAGVSTAVFLEYFGVPLITLPTIFAYILSGMGVVHYVDSDAKNAAFRIRKIDAQGCQACFELAKRIRKELENRGMVLDSIKEPNGSVVIRDLEVPKISSQTLLEQSDSEINSQRLPLLSQPLQPSEANKLDRDFMQRSKTLIAESQELKLSYESGISYLLDSDGLDNNEFQKRLRFRLEDLQKLLPYTQKVNGSLRVIESRISEVIERLRGGNAEANQTAEVHAQTFALDSAETASLVEREKLSQLERVIEAELKIIKTIINKQSEDSTGTTQSVREYLSFLQAQRNVDVDMIMKALGYLETVSSPESD